MSIETTLVKIVGKFLSKNSRKMEKNGKFDVTTTICENAKFLFCLTQLWTHIDPDFYHYVQFCQGFRQC